MKPMIIVPPGELTPIDIKKLEDNGICAVVAKHPERVKFVDPIPCQSSRTQIENAAIKLSRILLNRTWGNFYNSDTLGQREFAHMYVACLTEGTPLDRNGTIQDQECAIITAARRDELAKLARQDARSEREVAKAKKAAPPPPQIPNNAPNKG